MSKENVEISKKKSVKGLTLNEGDLANLISFFEKMYNADNKGGGRPKFEIELIGAEDNRGDIKQLREVLSENIKYDIRSFTVRYWGAHVSGSISLYSFSTMSDIDIRVSGDNKPLVRSFFADFEKLIDKKNNFNRLYYELAWKSTIPSGAVFMLIFLSINSGEKLGTALNLLIDAYLLLITLLLLSKLWINKSRYPALVFDIPGNEKRTVRKDFPKIIWGLFIGLLIPFMTWYFK